MKVDEHVPLSRLTTFKIGGPARYLLSEVVSEEAAAAAVFAKERALPLIPLGEGSNILAPDQGVDAVFVRFGAGFVKPVEINEQGFVTVVADAGVSWDSLVERAAKEGWWGIENLSGIPGTVGAAVVQNIGAYGAALAESVASVDAYDLKVGKRVTLDAKRCAFGYRTSIFKEERDRYLVTGVTFRFSVLPSPRLTYKDVAAHFAASGETPSLANIRRAVVAIRERKFPPLSAYGTAGSFFMNPVLDVHAARAVEAAFPGMPLFQMPEGGVKIPVAWILDRALNLKGFRVGGAFLWNAQPLVIAADPGSSSADVRSLAESVREQVKTRTGIDIFPEVRVM